LFKRLTVLIFATDVQFFKKEHSFLLRTECNNMTLIGSFSLSLSLSHTHTQEMVGSGARFEFSLAATKKTIINDPLSTKNMKNCATQFDAKPPKTAKV
jgi:hypothetical protein